jgi:hypothetical protein
MMICEIETEAAYPIIAGVIIKAGRHRIDVKGSFPFVSDEIGKLYIPPPINPKSGMIAKSFGSNFDIILWPNAKLSYPERGM